MATSNILFCILIVVLVVDLRAICDLLREINSTLLDLKEPKTTEEEKYKSEKELFEMYRIRDKARAEAEVRQKDEASKRT